MLTGKPNGKVPLLQMPRAFIDTETTGLDPDMHEIVEVAIVREMPDGTIDYWQSLVKPECPEAGDEKALQINGYADHPERWEHAPPFKRVAYDIEERLSGCLLIGHNVHFDCTFLQMEFDRAGIDFKLPYRTIDTATLIWEHVVPQGCDSMSLSKAAEFLGWSLENNHTALPDAKLARRMYHYCMSRNSRG